MEYSVTAIGALAAREEATLSLKVPGRVQTINVDLGSPVRRGQLLAQLEPQDYELHLEQAEALLAQARARLGLTLDGTDDAVDPHETSTVRQAKARLDEARSSRDRIVSLNAQGILSQSELEAAEAAYEVAANVYRDALAETNTRLALLAQRRVEVEIARQRLADTSIRAPFDGAVKERRASPGEYLGAGTAVLTVVSTDPLRLRLEVPEREAPLIRSGQTVRITIEGDAMVHTGVLSRVSPALELSTRMLTVEADVRQEGSLRPGSFTRAEIVVREQDLVTAVPRSAVVSFAGLEKVFAVSAGNAVERSVATGRRRGDWVEIIHGVEAGETVVLEPGNLQSGQPVQSTEPSVTAASPTS